MNASISIVLIDDHSLFRSGIIALIQRQEGFEIVGEAADGLEGIKLIHKLNPDIVLLDLDMPIMNGKAALKQILNINPDQNVLMLTVSENAEDLTECMRIGAMGFLLKNVDIDFLLESLMKVVHGDNVFSPEMTTKLVQRLIKVEQLNESNLPKKIEKSPLKHENNKIKTKEQSIVINNQQLLMTLTPRERDILSTLANGLSNKAIAEQYQLAESTVKAHVQNILRKLEIKNRIQAAMIHYQVNRDP